MLLDGRMIWSRQQPGRTRELQDHERRCLSKGVVRHYSLSEGYPRGLRGPHGFLEGIRYIGSAEADESGGVNMLPPSLL